MQAKYTIHAYRIDRKKKFYLLTITLILTCSQLMYAAQMDKNYKHDTEWHLCTVINSSQGMLSVSTQHTPVWEMWTNPHSICCAANQYLSERGCQVKTLKELSRSKVKFKCHQIQSLLGLTRLSFLQKLYFLIFITRWPYKSFYFRCWMVPPFPSPHSAWMMNARFLS